MRSTFYGLDIAAKGMFVSQRQLDVTGHNIANSNTEGYSRQRFITAAEPPPGAAQQFAPVTKGQVGQGVKTLTLDQIRDKFLDRQFRQETSKSDYWNTKNEALYYIEDVMNGDQSTNLSGVMGTFFNAMQELSKNPTDEAIRTNLVQESKKMTDVLHSYYSQMKDLMYQQDYALAQEVNAVNEITTQVAALNENIFKYEQGGQVANDLRDNRNLLLDKLAGMMDISYEEVGTGKFNINGLELTTMRVYAGTDNATLVDHTDVNLLEAVQDAGNAVTDDLGDANETERLLHSIRFVGGNNEYSGEILELSSGRLKAYQDIRDGETKEHQGIPYFISKLDEMAKALVETFNSIHQQGYTVPYTDVNNEPHSSTNGIDFFDPSSVTAATIRLSDDVLSSGFNIAASSLAVTKDETGHFNTGNNQTMLDLIKGVKERNDIDVIGSFEGFFKSYISELAAEVSHSKQQSAAESLLVDSLSSQKLSVMGVSIDEEMTNMVRFQHAYNAAARAITTMDELLDVLINRTGKAGL